jgi:hypothetical protein
MENDEDNKIQINQKDENKNNLQKNSKIKETFTLKEAINLNEEMIVKRSQARGRTVIDTIYRSGKFSLDPIYRQTKEKELLQSIANSKEITKETIKIAEQIDFKNLPDKMIKTDEFGFIISDNSSSCSDDDIILNSQKKSSKKEEKDKKNQLLKINARVEKWNHMLSKFDIYQTTKFSKLKSRTRKGIPDSLRGYVWQQISGANLYYVKDLFQKLDNQPIDKSTEDMIIKDLDRTFPNCSLFQDTLGNGQRKLLRVLSNYSKYNKEVGYIQGMGFICALLLTYMDEERTFFMLHTLIKKYELEGIYLPGFRDLSKKFFVLLNLEKKFIPKCYKIFKRDQLYPRCYATEWFICLFSRNLNFKILVRVFDTFLLEGFKVIYRFTLAFIKLKEKDFIEGKGGNDSTFLVINNCFENVDIKELFKIAFGFNITKKLIEGYEKEYEKVKNDKNNEFISQIL